MRDSSKLVPGRKYRIIDYVTTVGEVIGEYEVAGESHEYVKYASANHPFDIIVTALDIDKLDEVASCLLHEGDTYFSHVNISAWEIKYCLDNDTNRFEWADPDGKGVIYHMKDDRNNECDYDFKNILFWRCYVKDNDGGVHYIGLADYVGGRADEELPGINRNDYTYIYTFSIRGNLDPVNNDFYNDASVIDLDIHYDSTCNNNIIKNNTATVSIDEIDYKCSNLPNITIFNIADTYNVHSNIIQNSSDLVFTAFLINSSITGSVDKCYFLKYFKNLNISGRVYNTYFGYSDEFDDFISVDYINNVNIKGAIDSCNIFDCYGNVVKGIDSVELNGYITFSNIQCIKNVIINIVGSCVINTAENTQFYGEYIEAIFNYIKNSYINATLFQVRFNDNCINSNIQGELKRIIFTNSIPLQATINLYAPNNSNNSNISFKRIPSDQKIIIIEFVGISTGDLPSGDIGVSVDEEVLVPKLSVLINDNQWNVTRYQV